MVRYVYVDILFGVNLVMNLLILWATARLSDSKALWSSLTLAAALGAFYSVAVATNPETWVDAAVIKFLALIFMVALAFRPRSVAQVLRLSGFFLTLSFCVAGASLALSYVSGLSELSDLSPSWVALLGGMAFATYGLRLIADRFRLLGALPETVKAIISIGGKSVALDAFVDTGNQLHDPLSGLPVIVAERGVLRCLMPDDVRDVLCSAAGNAEEAIGDIGATSWATRLRVLPFESIGRKNGLLIGFRPDLVTLTEPDGRLARRNAIVGIVDRPMSTEGRYNALVGSTLLTRQHREVK